MSDITYEIHAWRKDGPAYVKRTHRPGFSNRRNRFEEEEIGARGGRSVAGPDYALLSADGDAEVWAFNKGHVYKLDAVVDGIHDVVTIVDATNGYQTLALPDGVSLEGITPQEHVDAGDDEDDVPASGEGASDEEE